MTETLTYFTDTGLVVSVTGNVAEFTLSDEHHLGEIFRVCDPATFFDDPLRNSASDLNGRTFKLGESIFILEGSYRYIEFVAPLSGTIHNAETGKIRSRRTDPKPQFISIHMSDPDELESLSKVPVPFSSATEEAHMASTEFPSILKCLGHTGEKIFHIEKKGDEFTLIEVCDWYYHTTLTREQLLRLSDELRRLAELDDVDPHFLAESAR